MERKETQNNQCNNEEEQNWKTDTIQLQDLLWCYGHQDSLVFVKD